MLISCGISNRGTTFKIYLPASEKEIVKEEPAPRTIAQGTETILLVDDEKMVLDVSKAMLESMGYRVYAAGSGQDRRQSPFTWRKEARSTWSFWI